MSTTTPTSMCLVNDVVSMQRKRKRVEVDNKVFALRAVHSNKRI
jgi:hypothetical protein